MIQVTENFGTVVVAVASIVSILITHVLVLRRTRGAFIFQTRANFFQEAYRDNLAVLHCISRIEANDQVKKNIQKIQQIIDERPHNFPFGFLTTWSVVGDKLMNPKPIEEIKSLLASIEDSLKFYSLKYFKEVLGIKQKELDLFSKALKGRMLTKTGGKSP